MIYEDKTIAAISTPRSAGGIGVIRISGEKAFETADKVFKCVSRKGLPSKMDGYSCAYGYVIDGNGEKIDDGVISIYRAPRSYTGENTAEISCHGGIYVTEKVLRRVLEAGAYPAAAGEFTKRAYINGKMSLTEAESVMDIISAEGNDVYRRTRSVKEGSLYKRIKVYSDRLVKILGQIGAWVDYPEEDIPEIGEEGLKGELEEISAELKKISEVYDNTRILKAGIETVIAGRPNVGKSTLMNLLAGYEKSIVTDIAGTTRDIVEESVRLGDIVLRLSDTAGLRSSEDIIEGIGIKKAEEKIKNADLVIAVFDNGEELNDDDERLIKMCGELKGAKVIACINKSDKEGKTDRSLIEENFENVMDISAKKGEGADKLREVLEKLFMGNMAYDDITVNERQKICLDRAQGFVEEALEALKGGITIDAVNIVLDDALNCLLELTGERVSEAVVNEVFSHFCVGK
ncbi:MAG: tRNA uridine-5-carboxymethylaminomethyl(34) synthesis GTPase MnmE [Ruminococcus sp.]|nr:tRNA uridine-5-carboxymethylaminomethyl(34) synthesis GTPase MnmE [Ruminococcus sp.]